MKGRLVRGALLALCLAGCAHKTEQQAQARTLDTMQIYAKNVAGVSQRVAQSALPQTDKLAFAAMIDQHRAKLSVLDGKTVRDIINQERAYEVGLLLGAQERANDLKHEKLIVGIMSLAVIGHRDEDHRIVLTLRVQNKTAKTMRRFDSGIEVHDTKGTRLGIAEFETQSTIAPHQTAAITIAIPYLRFGEDAGSMRLAAGKAKSIDLDVKEIKYTDGTDAGYDD